MKKILYPKTSELATLLQRPVQNNESLRATAEGIFSEIERNGDQAVAKYTKLFDGVSLNDFKISKKVIETAANTISARLKEAITVAYNNITSFHEAQQTPDVSVETQLGVHCWQEKRAIEAVGLYIPGGSAPLFSTVMMLAIPAKIAGCKRVILCSPPNKKGEIAPEILYTAQLCGVEDIYAVGGIQAIGALTFGTQSIPKVDKIFGPGNRYVTAAKQLALQFGVAIDMPAGPSEVMVFADDTAIPKFVAADLLSQAEHGPDSQVILVCTSEKIMNKVAESLVVQLDTLPRKEVASKALAHSRAIVVKTNSEALAIINAYAPEHLILAVSDAKNMARKVEHAGSVFLGNYTPESAGDYASGTNHTLPTYGFARQYSGVTLDSFTKNITFQEITQQGLQALGPHVACMAAAEGLAAHQRAVNIRLVDDKE
ncbi:MAG: histidinol dehydrogenase [Flavobacteriaceae bacterium]|nr:histidinol dehydrogenase [Flavobacteriaceae bacterium]|tara:strand:+ start:10169 stop:11455 length:1287 start_codon:yes stop_codon:yes gene_type:complete